MALLLRRPWRGAWRRCVEPERWSSTARIRGSDTGSDPASARAPKDGSGTPPGSGRDSSGRRTEPEPLWRSSRSCHRSHWCGARGSYRTHHVFETHCELARDQAGRSFLEDARLSTPCFQSLRGPHVALPRATPRTLPLKTTADESRTVNG